jgi:ABC-type polysaccharide/polyol phosphate export permease
MLLVMRDIRTRYTRSALGLYWAVIEPLMVAAVFTVVFSVLVRIPTGNIPYVLFLLSGLLPWNLLSNSVAGAVSSIVRNPNLITKVYFPRELMPAAAVLARLVDFAAALAILVLLIRVFGLPVPVTILLVPAVAFCQLMLCLGIGLLVAAANVHFRDVERLTGVLLMLLMYLTPVLYPPELIPARYVPIFSLNPMAGFVDTYRRLILLDRMPDPGLFGYAVATSAAVLCLGYLIFKRYDARFADLV